MKALKNLTVRSFTPLISQSQLLKSKNSKVFFFLPFYYTHTKKSHVFTWVVEYQNAYNLGENLDTVCFSPNETMTRWKWISKKGLDMERKWNPWILSRTLS